MFELRGWKCERCSSETKQLHLHHLFYRKNTEITALSAVVVSCNFNEKDFNRNLIVLAHAMQQSGHGILSVAGQFSRMVTEIHNLKK